MIYWRRLAGATYRFGRKILNSKGLFQKLVGSDCTGSLERGRKMAALPARTVRFLAM